ncbi:TlpA disulfide reductase family protein [Flavobacterium sp. DG1-102-2]|uniref:TlpA family protein disulfide reductase n=1 Tax=Flavobacterium sp. DG1-102-2 TaxID=3081663 RepID=UPI00294A48E5|nr:TlpA disulfide reductase family protein [Flavobacterium sp. DG1-102-2]MDV6167469.1 TlpA disulfide reductase family protein [Flavobacterium sp. DG1-102-2]
MKKFALLFLIAITGAYAQTEQVKFAAVIKNRNTDSIFIRSQRAIVKVMKADAKGNFKGEFPAEPGFYQLGDGAETTSLYLKPGFDLALTMDAKMFDETIVYKGKGEKENNFLAKMALEQETFGEKLAKVTDPGEQTKMINDLLNKTENGLKDPALDETFRTVLTQQLAAQKQQMAAQAEQDAKIAKMIGQQSPSFAYENFKGGTTKLEDFKGKYVYIDMWATWCGPCRQEIPFLQKVEEKYHGKKIEFVSISIDQVKDHEKWKKMVTDKTLGGVQLFADKDWSSAFAQAYGVNSIPRFILIGPDGKVIDADAKRPSDPALQAQLDTLLK